MKSLREVLEEVVPEVYADVIPDGYDVVCKRDRKNPFYQKLQCERGDDLINYILKAIAERLPKVGNEAYDFGEDYQTGYNQALTDTRKALGL